MDELYAFLFAGLFILLMLFIFFGVYQPAPYYPPKNNITNITPPGNLTWKIIDLGDISISKQNLRKRETISESYKVSNGLFFGENSYRASYRVDKKILDNLEKASFSYSVKDSNKYGDLKIRFNNQTLHEGKQMIGKYSYEVELKEENIIEIRTTSSGWKIWAPSVYLLSNISMDLNYILQEYPRYDFYVSNYIYRNLKKSEIIFDFIEGEGELAITFNNETIYEEFPKTGISIVELINIRENKNEIVFSSEKNIKLENVKIRLYYYS